MYGESVLDVCIGAREAAQHWGADSLNRLIIGRPGSLDPTKRSRQPRRICEILREGSPP